MYINSTQTWFLTITKKKGTLGENSTLQFYMEKQQKWVLIRDKTA